MSKKKKGPSNAKDAAWQEAKQVCRLSLEDIRKAKALGFTPKSLMKNKPSPSQRWKAPTHIWVRDLYERKFGDRERERSPRKETLAARAAPPPTETWLESTPFDEPLDENEDCPF